MEYTTDCCIYFIMFLRQVNHLKVSESLNFKFIISIENVFYILAYFSLFFIFLGRNSNEHFNIL